MPLILRLRGPKSFASLVKDHAGEPRTLTILDELLRVRAVRKLPDGKIEVISRTVANLRWDANGIEGLGEQVRVYLETLAYNLKHPGQPQFTRVILNAQLDPHFAPIVIRDTNRQAEHFASVLERTINKPSATIKPKSRHQDALRFSVSISLWEEPVVIEPKPRTPPKGGRT